MEGLSRSGYLFFINPLLQNIADLMLGSQGYYLQLISICVFVSFYHVYYKSYSNLFFNNCAILNLFIWYIILVLQFPCALKQMIIVHSIAMYGPNFRLENNHFPAYIQIISKQIFTLETNLKIAINASMHCYYVFLWEIMLSTSCHF